MGLDVLARARMRVITGDTPQHAPLRRHLPLNLQKQDHPQVNSYTTSVDVTDSRGHSGETRRKPTGAMMVGSISPLSARRLNRCAS